MPPLLVFAQLDRLRYELPIESYIKLAQLCKSIDLDFGCGIFDQEAYDALYPYLSYSKISSGEIHHIPTLSLHAQISQLYFLRFS